MLKVQVEGRGRRCIFTMYFTLDLSQQAEMQSLCTQPIYTVFLHMNQKITLRLRILSYQENVIITEWHIFKVFYVFPNVFCFSFYPFQANFK